jgi:hypothetical protein
MRGDAQMWVQAIVVGVAFAMAMALLDASAQRRGYHRGACAALNAQPVADTLCVRWDTIVARVRWEASDE